MELGSFDVFMNVVGGVKIAEPSVDLAVALVVASSLRNEALPDNLLVFGEIGLSGEIRPVSNGIERLREASKHGFTHAIIPKANAPTTEIKGLKITAINKLEDAFEIF
ncbi:MAG: hypothetical protein COB50_03195 [Thiotrichales bacterium]|nr:MAG: hypothetical protein COB50_03195 [Thiotrichales bacterium]